MTEGHDDPRQAADYWTAVQVAHAMDTAIGSRSIGPLITALAAARAEGYRAAVEDSRRFCARSGGCIS